ncbi:MAG: SanA protein, partial [Cyclobacteriaceae bacterium]
MIIKRFIQLISIAVVLVLILNLWVYLSTREYLIYDVEYLKPVEVSMVLGTSRMTVRGDKNPYFENRMDAVSTLFSEGKTQKILVSGDHETPYYDEPKDMSEALGLRNVPDSAILRDEYGLRTLDSVIRLKTVFGQKKVIIVTQQYHGYRAIFIARHLDIDAKLFVAASPDHISLSHYLREMIARPLAIIDLFVLNTQPKYLNVSY